VKFHKGDLVQFKDNLYQYSYYGNGYIVDINKNELTLVFERHSRQPRIYRYNYVYKLILLSDVFRED
jgi:hypothetical protein